MTRPNPFIVPEGETDPERDARLDFATSYRGIAIAQLGALFVKKVLLEGKFPGAFQPMYAALEFGLKGEDMGEGLAEAVEWLQKLTTEAVKEDEDEWEMHRNGGPEVARTQRDLDAMGVGMVHPHFTGKAFHGVSDRDDANWEGNSDTWGSIDSAPTSGHLSNLVSAVLAEEEGERLARKRRGADD